MSSLRLSPAAVPQVVWEDGMHLSAHHFQAQRRHHEDLVTRTLDSLLPFGWGLSDVALDIEALRNGTLALLHARGLLPDGTSFDLPDSDPLPAPSPLSDRFSPTQEAHTVHLAIAAWHADQPNVYDPASSSPAAAQSARFAITSRVVADETIGGDPLEVRFATRRMRLLLDHELTDDLVSLPIARVKRNREGRFVTDDEFIPPIVRIGASAALTELLRRVIGMIEEKARSVAASVSHAPLAGAGAAGYAGNELATRWLLHTLKSAEAPLRHMLLTRLVHPERLFLELSRVASALCTFSISVQPRDLPTYDHANPGPSFAGLEYRLREQLDVVVSSQVIVVPLTMSTGVRHIGLQADSGAAVSGTPIFVGDMPDGRAYEPGARWFLGVNAAIERHELIDRMQRLVKVCASKFVLALVQRAVQGLPLEHIPTPPAALAPRQDLTYFELTLSGPCALTLRESREIGVYFPDAIPSPYVEAIVLVAD
jgi:type VI secretion system protein ImpJ